MPLNREQFMAAARQFQPQPVEVPEIGTIYLRPMSLDGLGSLRDAQANGQTAKVAAVMIIDAVCDESGKQLLTQDDEGLVRMWPMATVDRLVGIIQSASGLDGEAGDALGNSDGTP